MRPWFLTALLAPVVWQESAIAPPWAQTYTQSVTPGNFVATT